MGPASSQDLLNFVKQLVPCVFLPLFPAHSRFPPHSPPFKAEAGADLPITSLFPCPSFPVALLLMMPHMYR